ncbi:hypothetical protein FXW27_02020 [Candidatus Liberibacter asiaticus]|nr:hypothetical protein FXW27_02020 [Candidatus Liberibacter asiaticus]
MPHSANSKITVPDAAIAALHVINTCFFCSLSIIISGDISHFETIQRTRFSCDDTVTNENLKKGFRLTRDATALSKKGKIL